MVAGPAQGEQDRKHQYQVKDQELQAVASTFSGRRV
jgi:hypothetical protein